MNTNTEDKSESLTNILWSLIARRPWPILTGLSAETRQKLFSLFYREMQLRYPNSPGQAVAGLLDVSLPALNGYKKGQYRLSNDHLPKVIMYLSPLEWLPLVIEDLLAQLRVFISEVSDASAHFKGAGTHPHIRSQFQIGLLYYRLPNSQRSITLGSELICDSSEGNGVKIDLGRELPEWVHLWAFRLGEDYWLRALDQVSETIAKAENLSNPTQMKLLEDLNPCIHRLEVLHATLCGLPKNNFTKKLKAGMKRLVERIVQLVPEYVDWKLQEHSPLSSLMINKEEG